MENNNTRIEGSPNYPFKAGMLESAMRCMTYGNIPGVTITDAKAFENWIEDKLIELHNRAVKFNKGEF